MNNEIVIFTDGDVSIEVQINPEEETVWLTQKQMGELFGVKQGGHYHAKLQGMVKSAL